VELPRDFFSDLSSLRPSIVWSGKSTFEEFNDGGVVFQADKISTNVLTITLIAGLRLQEK